VPDNVEPLQTRVITLLRTVVAITANAATVAVAAVVAAAAAAAAAANRQIPQVRDNSSCCEHCNPDVEK